MVCHADDITCPRYVHMKQQLNVLSLATGVITQLLEELMQPSSCHCHRTHGHSSYAKLAMSASGSVFSSPDAVSSFVERMATALRRPAAESLHRLSQSASRGTPADAAMPDDDSTAVDPCDLEWLLSKVCDSWV